MNIKSKLLSPLPDIKDIREAAGRIQPYIKKTPVLTSTSLNDLIGAQLFFKCENFQKTGAFKIRGACNAVFSLSEEEAIRGVATHSSGNHAAALSLAAKLRGIHTFIVMPRTAPTVKKLAVEGYGAQITFCEPTQASREGELNRIVETTGAQYIPSYNHFHVIAGQGTAALELMEEIESPDIVIAPVGGGGLMSGTALAVKGFSPAVRVIGAEPAGADDAFRSLKEGKIIPSENPQTIADGLLMSLGPLTFEIIRKNVDKIITVSEEGIITAMRTIWERMKIIIEPSSAVPVAALIENPEEFSGKRIGIILSGGNVDLDRLPWVR